MQISEDQTLYLNGVMLALVECNPGKMFRVKDYGVQVADKNIWHWCCRLTISGHLLWETSAAQEPATVPA